MRIISADDHVNPDPTLYGERLPAEFQDRAPRVEQRGDREVLVFEGTEKPFFGLPGAAGTAAKDVQTLSKSKQSGRKGGWDPDARIEDMAFDGVEAQVIFGSGDGGGIEIKSENRPFRAAMMRAYNDWVAEFCRPYPSKLIGIAEVPYWDVDLALAEARRAVDLGLRGVCIPAVPAHHGSPAEDRWYGDPSYEKLWVELAAMELPVHFHLGTLPSTRGIEQDLMATISINKSSMSEPIASFIFSGVLERNPTLKVVSVESGIGWMAFLVPWMDHVFQKHRYHTGSKLPEPPSFYFHRQVFGTFIDDVVGVRNRDIIGVDNIMWSSDYPHINSSWPESRAYIDRHFGDVPDDEKAKMVGGNAARLYHL